MISAFLRMQHCSSYRPDVRNYKNALTPLTLYWTHHFDYLYYNDEESDIDFGS